MLIRVGERKVGQRFRIRLNNAAYLEWISNVLRSISETCGPLLPESRNGSVGMLRLVAEEDLPKDKDGRLLLGGLFAVDEDELVDRLIFDRRPENSTMRRLDWCQLAGASCFVHLLLQDDEVLRGSGDDIITMIIISLSPKTTYVSMLSVDVLTNLF